MQGTGGTRKSENHTLLLARGSIHKSLSALKPEPGNNLAWKLSVQSIELHSICTVLIRDFVDCDEYSIMTICSFRICDIYIQHRQMSTYCLHVKYHCFIVSYLMV